MTEKPFPKLPPDLEAASRPKEPDLSRYVVCAICGQTYDLSDLAQAFHHTHKSAAPE